MADEFAWGTYTEGGAFITELEKLTYISSGAKLLVTAVRDGEGQYGPQFYLDFVDPAGEEKCVGFKKGNSERDDRLERLQATIAASGEPIPARLTKIGRRYDVTGA